MAVRVVKPDEKAARDLTVAEAAESGTERELLVSLRRVLARSVDDPKTPPRDLSTQSRSLLVIDEKIRAIDARAAQEGTDDGGHVTDGEFDSSAV